GLVFFHIDETARGDLRSREHRPVASYRERDRDQAVLGEQLPVAEDHGPDLADGLAVDENTPGGEAPDQTRLGLRDLDAHAVFDQEDPVGPDPDALGETGVAEEMTVLSVHQDEVPGPRQVEHHLQVFLARVTGDM